MMIMKMDEKITFFGLSVWLKTVIYQLDKLAQRENFKSATAVSHFVALKV